MEILQVSKIISSWALLEATFVIGGTPVFLYLYLCIYLYLYICICVSILCTCIYREVVC